jgi:tRNA threonylcarbamoyladenosine biosynthesis protein TsaE
MSNYELILADENAMLAAASAYAAKIRWGSVIWLQGQLGAGKTTWVRGLLRGMGYDGPVKSPTYTFVESYSFGRHVVHHFDLYRLADPEELEFLGWRDYLSPNALCLIEWPERAEVLLPAPQVTCKIDLLQKGRRLRLEER